MRKNTPPSRRDFLKLAGLGFGSLAFRPSPLESVKRLPVDGECDGGTCCRGSCSECCPDVEGDACDGRSCEGYIDGEGIEFGPVYLCDRSDAPGVQGAACLVDTDCSSSDCDLPGPQCLVRCMVPDSHCDDFEITCRWSEQLVGTCR